MSKNIVKLNSKKVLESIRNEQLLNEKQNVTFRLSVVLMNRLKSKCERENVSMAKVLEQLIKSFLEN